MSCRALVTGGTRGIGLAAARGLVKSGCRNIALFARGTGGVEEAIVDIKRLGGNPLFIKGDLRSRESIERLVPFILEKWGRLDVVVMSYGNLACEPCSLEASKWDDWIEASSMYLASTGVIARDLVKRNSVRAIFIIFSSFTVNEPHHPLFISDTVRLGFRALIRVLARNYSSKLRPILVELGSFMTPGAIATIAKLAKAEGEDFNRYWSARVEGLSPLRRSGMLDEVEELVSLIVRSPDYMTGAVIRFDGASTSCI